MYQTIVTGGSGLLGTELKKYFPDAFYPSHKDLDISKGFNIYSKPSLVIHCAALKVNACDQDPVQAMRTNILGTCNVVNFCHKTKAKLIYISTDCVFSGERGNYKIDDDFNPVSYYGMTKLAGELAVKALKEHLIIRLSFFPNEFPYDKAFTDQITTRMTVAEAAKRIFDNKEKIGTIHLAGKKQSLYDFAVETSPAGRKIEQILIKNFPVKRPKDTSLVE